MAVTRAKATALLNKTEMGLFDDSRSNALRGHSDARLNQLVGRARTARDRARDLEKRQRLASRGKTGSKSGRSGQANARTGEKVELLADILQRFEDRQKQVARDAKRTPAARATKSAQGTVSKAAAKKSAIKAPVTKSSAAKRTTDKDAATPSARKTPTRTATAKKAAAKSGASRPARAAKRATASTSKTGVGDTADGRVSAGTAGARKTSAGKKSDGAAAAKPAARTRRKTDGITPEKALRNTRKLLEQRTQEAQAGKSWEAIGTDGANDAAPGFQSPQARAKALQLHAAEIRQAPIQGSSSTRDRRNQGKRDSRNSTDD